MYMKEASYTMEKVNDEYKLKEVVDGVAQFVGDSISSTGQGEIVGGWFNPIEINNINIVGSHIPFRKDVYDCPMRLKKIDSIINYYNEEADFTSLLYKATNLEYIKEIRSSKVYNFAKSFYGCEKIENLPELDFSISWSKTMNFTETFKKCYKLKEVRIKNLKGDTFGKDIVKLDFSDCLELSNESINNIINNISKHTNDNNPYTLVFNNNKENYFVNTYCKILNREDDYLPMEVTDSFTDVAITLREYVTTEKGIPLLFNEVDSQ